MKNRGQLILLGSEYSYRMVLAILGLLTAKLMKLDQFGSFISALALAQIVAIIVEAGMGHFVAKEMARDPDFKTRRMGQTLTWRIVAGIVGCLMGPLIGWLFLTSPEARHQVFWLTPGVLLLATVDFLAWILKGGQHAPQAAFVLFTTRIFLFVLALLALLSPYQTPLLISAYFAAGLGGVLLAWRSITRFFPALKPEPITRHFYKDTLPTIYKMGAFLIGTVAFTRFDLILVLNLCGKESAAVYGCAARIFDVLAFFPAAIYAVFMPSLSSVQNDPLEFRRRFSTAAAAMILLALVIIVVGHMTAARFIDVLFGSAYAPSVPLLKPLLASAVFAFCNTMLYALFFVWNDFKAMGWAILAGLVVLIAFNLLFLPKWGVIAASWSRFWGESIIFSTLGIRLWSRRIRFSQNLVPVGGQT